MSREDLIHYYETRPSDLGKPLVGHLWTRYVRNYPRQIMQYQPEDTNIEDSYATIPAIWFKDQACVDEMARIVNFPENNAAIVRDEENFRSASTRACSWSMSITPVQPYN